MRRWLLALTALAAAAATVTVYVNMQSAYAFGIARVVLQNNTGTYVFTYDPPTLKISSLAVPQNIIYEAMYVDIVARGRGTMNRTLRILLSDRRDIVFTGVLMLSAEGPVNITSVTVYVDGQKVGTFSGNPIIVSIRGREVALSPVSLSLASSARLTLRMTNLYVSPATLQSAVPLFDPEVEVE